VAVVVVDSQEQVVQSEDLVVVVMVIMKQEKLLLNQLNQEIQALMDLEIQVDKGRDILQVVLKFLVVVVVLLKLVKLGPQVVLVVMEKLTLLVMEQLQ
jgi:hypothetical protein